MRTQARFLLMSVALNVTLAIVAGHALFAPRDQPPTAPGEDAHPSVSGDTRDSAHVTSFAGAGAEIARLRALGLSIDETMPVILDLLERQAAAAAPAGAGKYWESDWQNAARESLLARARQTAAIRAALLEAYGPEAENAAPLREIFRPLAALYPFLTPAEQRAIVQYRLTRPVRMIAGASPMGLPPPAPATAGVSMRTEIPIGAAPAGGAFLAGSHAEFMASLPTSLSQASAFEFALRDSPLAARIRAAHADLAEQEFRALFVAMADAEQNRKPLTLDPTGGKVPRAKVLKVIAHGDPAWSALETAASRSALPEQQLWAVYEVIRDTSESLAAVMRSNDQPMTDRAERLTALTRERDRKIARLVGDDAASSLLNAFDESYRSLALRSSQLGAARTPVR